MHDFWTEDCSISLSSGEYVGLDEAFSLGRSQGTL